MTTLHPTTMALLKAADAFADAPVSNDDKETTRLRSAAMDWWRAGRPDLTTPTPDRLSELEARVAALERAQAPTPTPEPPRFVPTEPGIYWRKAGVNHSYIACVTFDPNGLQNRLAWNSGSDRIPVTDDGLWLAPVAPYAPQQTRTEAEARAKPMRGDRWRAAYSPLHYTLTKPTRGVFWEGVWSDREATVVYSFDPGRPGETYLGNFAHELEGP